MKHIYIYLLIISLIVLLTSCDDTSSKQEMSIDMQIGKGVFVDRVITTEKFTLHENGRGYDVELFEVYDGDIHYKIFRVGGDHGGMTTVNFTNDSLRTELFKLQINEIKNGSSSDNKALKK